MLRAHSDATCRRGTQGAPATEGIPVRALLVVLALLSATGAPRATAANANATSGSCAQRYGSLMADHWLTVDLARQIERGLFYHPGAETARAQADFEKLEQTLASTEQDLSDALDRYRYLVASNS